MQSRSYSVSILNLQNTIKTEESLNHNKNFVPFVQERVLGKLIKEDDDRKGKLKIEEINFKNFRQIYRREALQ